MTFIILLSYFYKFYFIFIVKTYMKRDKNLKITPKTHELLKKYCQDNGLKMFAYVESLIKRNCILKQNYENKQDMYDED